MGKAFQTERTNFERLIDSANGDARRLRELLEVGEDILASRRHADGIESRRPKY